MSQETENSGFVFKTPAKLSVSPVGDNEDLSTTIPTKPSPSPHLPPVETKENPQIIVQKKRKLQLVADPDDQPDHVIPTKSRSVSSVSTDSKRVPSLSLISKPTLSPPEPNKSYRNFDESTPSLDKPSVINPVSLEDLDQYDNFSSPSKPEKVQSSTPQSIIDLRRAETKLDTEIRNAKSTLETLKRARVILKNQDSSSNEELIEKWRDAAQKASHYLLNAAIEKINRRGGKKEFVKKEKETLKESYEYSIDSSFHERIHDITNSEEYENLPEKEQERILEELEKQHEKLLEEAEKTFLEHEENDDNTNNDEDPDEFTMKDLYKRLKLDYKLVFPDE